MKSLTLKQFADYCQLVMSVTGAVASASKLVGVIQARRGKKKLKYVIDVEGLTEEQVIEAYRELMSRSVAAK